MKDILVILLIVIAVVFILYQYDPTMFGMLSEGFETMKGSAEPAKAAAHGDDSKRKSSMEDKSTAKKEAEYGTGDMSKNELKDKMGLGKKGVEGFSDLEEGPANFGSSAAPAGCYPRDQLTPSELLPKDSTSVWAEQNPMGPGSLKGKNFLSAGSLIGVNTVGQSLRNANLQLRSEPPNPQVPVSVWNVSTITPDISHRPLEIGA
jgi:hypothetical protein